MAAEQMNETPSFLIQLGEALGPWGSLVFLLLLCGGAVWVVMSVRRNKEDHDRFKAKVDNGFNRLETKVDSSFARLEGSVDTVGESVHTFRESVEGKIHTFRESVEGKIESSRKESRDELRAINTRLDGIIGQKPPDRPDKL